MTIYRAPVEDFRFLIHEFLEVETHRDLPLYEDLSPAPLPRQPEPLFGIRDAGAGRPTKKERRETDRLADDD